MTFSMRLGYAYHAVEGRKLAAMDVEGRVAHAATNAAVDCLLTQAAPTSSTSAATSSLMAWRAARPELFGVGAK